MSAIPAVANVAATVAKAVVGAIKQRPTKQRKRKLKNVPKPKAKRAKLGDFSSITQSAPVIRSTVSSGTSMTIRRTKVDCDLCLHVRMIVAEIQIQPGSTGTVANFISPPWGNNYFGTNLGLIACPLDPTAYSVLSSLASQYSMFRFGQTIMTYDGECGTDNSGKLLFLPSADPQTAVRATAVPNAVYSSILSAPAAIPCNYWGHAVKDISHQVNHDWVYGLNTNSGDSSANRLGTAGCIVIVGNTYTTNAAALTTGSLVLEFDLDLKNYVGSSLE